MSLLAIVMGIITSVIGAAVWDLWLKDPIRRALQRLSAPALPSVDQPARLADPPRPAYIRPAVVSSVSSVSGAIFTPPQVACAGVSTTSLVLKTPHHGAAKPFYL